MRCFLTCLLLAFLCAPAFARSLSERPSRREAVLEQAFASSLQPQFPGATTVIRLWFLPSFHAESALTIVIKDGKTRVEYLWASKQLEAVMNERGGRRKSVKQLVAAMGVQSKTFEVDAKKTSDWLAGFWSRLRESAAPLERLSEKNVVQLDGTKYEVIYKSSMVDLSMSFLGSEIGSPDKNDLPVVVWALELRHFAIAQSAGSVPTAEQF